MELKGKIVTVVGLGNSGLNAAILLGDMGAVVRVTDSKDTPEVQRNAAVLSDRNVKLEIGRHTRDFIKESVLVIVSPGVEDSSPAIRYAVELDIPTISEMELGYRFCRGRIIAITGTNGKSTVTSLIGEMLKTGGKDTVVCGNIGNALCGEIGRIKETTLVVLEVSSFQLERIQTFKPYIAAILNITDDHLDRYKTFKDYFDEKSKVFRNQDKDDILILNYDTGNLMAMKAKANSRVLSYSKARELEGAYAKNGRIIVSLKNGEEEISHVNEIKLKGLHNLENVLVSSLIARLAGVNAASIRSAINNFKGLTHRFETVGVIDGVEYIDDSKGTTVDSTYRALESCAKDVVLIAGGRDKNSDYRVIKEMVRKKVRGLVLIGEAKDRIKNFLGGDVKTYDADTLSEAVKIARGIAKAGMAVLLSPMCSSFDMFKDYKERGEVFKEAVRNLKRSAVAHKDIS